MNISKGNILMFCEHDEFGEDRELATHGLNVMLCYVRSAKSHGDFDRKLDFPISLST